MTYDELKRLVDQFELKVANAWIYDTKIGYDDFYNPGKLNKADLLMNELHESKLALLAAIKELTDA